MRSLQFAGTVSSGRSTPPEPMVLPGRDELLVAPEDWPQRFAPGTLTINLSGPPDGLAEVGQGEGLARLDDGKFRAALVIPQRKIAHNPVPPDRDRPTKGFAQVWRAQLQVAETGQTEACWMVRLIADPEVARFALAAERDLRDTLKLSAGAAVVVTVWEAEPPPAPPSPEEVIADWCEATREIDGHFGPEEAMGYLVGEKFLRFLEIAEKDPEWRRAIPRFVAGIHALFEPWQLAGFLNTPRRLGPLGHTATDEGHRMLREALDDSQRAHEDARNLLLLEWAKELLLDEPADTGDDDGGTAP